MLVMYGYLLFLILSISNVYLVWLMMELMFIFFLLTVLNYESKSVGLVIYFFFQSVVSLLLFITIFFSLDKIIFLLLSAKLGMFPFFYWMIIVSVKVGYIGNLFVLSLQKLPVFWLVWLTFNISFNFLLFFVYCGIFFVMLNLVMVNDLWMMMIYSSVANAGMILMSVVGSHYVLVMLLYMSVIFLIIFFLMKMDSYMELMLVVFFFLVVPPFILFFMKFYIILSMDFMLKLGFFLAVFDVLVLLYYFSLVFMKFMLLDSGILIYMMNMLLLVMMMIMSNCVAMIVFY